VTTCQNHDYLFGGKDHFAADRELAERVLVGMPSLRTAARENRAFLGRAVWFLAAEAGIRQFLDIGTGLPTNSARVMLLRAGLSPDGADRVRPAVPPGRQAA
jgi:S-adenosyl methyltransferase